MSRWRENSHLVGRGGGGASGEATWRRWHLQWVLEVLKAEDMGCGSANSG